MSPTPALPVFQRGGLIGGAVPGAGLSARLGIDITITPAPLIMAAQFDTLSAQVRSFRVPLERTISQVMIPSFQKNFDVGGRPPWESLSDYTLERRSREGYGSKPLVKSGKLKRRATQKSRWTIDGSKGQAFIAGLPEDIWYGAIHQEGLDVVQAAFIPARPFYVVQPEDIDNMEKVFEKWIGERVQATVARGPG